MPRGYDRPLYILPFDHRGSFQTRLFGWKPPLSDAQTAEIAATKRVIYDGFKSALDAGVPKDKAGILVEEQFGAAILHDAKGEGVVTASPAEMSGQEGFDFEYGEAFAHHIEAFDPTFCKVLVRYNPEGDRALNLRQAERLKRLSDFLAGARRSRFMFELLVPAEEVQLDRLKGDKKRFDSEFRPRLMSGPSANSRLPASIRIYGSSRVLIVTRIARRSWRRHGPATAIGSVASFLAAARTTRKCWSGCESRRRCPASSALPSAARPSGIRWLPGETAK
jgi:hypothetical protein